MKDNQGSIGGSGTGSCGFFWVFVGGVVVPRVPGLGFRVSDLGLGLLTFTLVQACTL